MGRGFISRWALPASLAFNVFLATVLIFQPPHRPRHPGGPPPSPMVLVQHLAEELPAADAAILRQVAARHGQEMESQHAVWSALPLRIRDALAAPVFDAVGLRAVLDEGKSAHRAMDDSLADLIMEAASAMSPEGRQAVARFRPPPPPHGPPPPPR
ncbi:MAG: periplasmic heavy metal sensor [Magnetospirillum sp.]|nr:periplasmic heavy metal sensor [Magnetospirillum sp.]